MAYNPIISPMPVGIQEITTGGASIKNYISGDLSGDQVPVATGSSKVTGWYIFNGAASIARIAFYDATTAPIIGSLTNFKFSIVIPAGSAANVAIPAGIQFTTGISFNIGAAVPNNDSASISASAVSVNIIYKV